jgi:hypothetical protein
VNICLYIRAHNVCLRSWIHIVFSSFAKRRTADCAVWLLWREYPPKSKQCGMQNIKEQKRKMCTPWSANVDNVSDKIYGNIYINSKAVQLHAMVALGSCPDCTLSWVKDPSTHWTGGWVGPRNGLDTEVRGRILCPCQGSNLSHPVIQSIVRHYTDWGTPATIYTNNRNSFFKIYVAFLKLVFKTLS